MFPTTSAQYIERINSARPHDARLKWLIYGSLSIWLALSVWSYFNGDAGFGIRMVGMVFMAPMLWAIRKQQQLHRDLGISCPHCRRPNNSGMALNSLLSSGRCYGCGTVLLKMEDSEKHLK
jgi:hypothetical protein